MEAFSDRERYSLLVLSLLAVLLFFSPLLSIQVPMTGEQQVTGYDVVSRVNNIKQNLQSAGGEKEDTPPPQQRQGSSVELPKMPELPTSIKLAWMIPAAIIVAWVCAVVTILGAFTDTNFARIGTTVGTCAAIWAAIHVSILNSDMHSWFSASMQSSQQELKDNPFASLTQNFGQLIANAFQLKAGWGLFALIGFMGLSALLAFSRILDSGKKEANAVHI